MDITNSEPMQIANAPFESQYAFRLQSSQAEIFMGNLYCDAAAAGQSSTFL